MKMLEDRIRKDGIVREGNVLKVDSFINHQMDIPLFQSVLHISAIVFPSYFPIFSCKIALNRHFFMHNSLFGGDDDGEGKMS